MKGRFDSHLGKRCKSHSVDSGGQGALEVSLTCSLSPEWMRRPRVEQAEAAHACVEELVGVWGGTGL